MAKPKPEPDATSIPGVPELLASPPTEPVTVLPGPQPEPPPEPEPKKRRKRKAKPEPEPTPDGVSPQDLENCKTALSQTFAIASKVVAQKRGAHWLLSDDETASLADAWTAALAPYLPKIGAAMPWATALVITGVMVLPRLDQDRALREQAEVQPATRPERVP